MPPAGALQQSCALQQSAACQQRSPVSASKAERRRAVAVFAASSAPLPADDSFSVSIPQAPVQSLVQMARVLLKFSRPHTLLGTLVSVNSVSLLGLVRHASCAASLSQDLGVCPPCSITKGPARGHCKQVRPTLFGQDVMRQAVLPITVSACTMAWHLAESKRSDAAALGLTSMLCRGRTISAGQSWPVFCRH